VLVKMVKTVEKPNPVNTQNAEKVQELGERIKGLKEERAQWQKIVQPPPRMPLVLDSARKSPTSSGIDPSLLDPEQASILTSLAAPSSEDVNRSLKDRLKLIHSDMEFKVDQLRDGVHKLDQYRGTLDRVATKVLAYSALRVEERDKREKEAVGTRDMPIQEVLRSLSRILPEGSGGTSGRQ